MKTVVQCAWCRRYKDEHGEFNFYPPGSTVEPAKISHSICQKCAATLNRRELELLPCE